MWSRVLPSYPCDVKRCPAITGKQSDDDDAHPCCEQCALKEQTS